MAHIIFSLDSTALIVLNGKYWVSFQFIICKKALLFFSSPTILQILPSFKGMASGFPKWKRRWDGGDKENHMEQTENK